MQTFRDILENIEESTNSTSIELEEDVKRSASILQKTLTKEAQNIKSALKAYERFAITKSEDLAGQVFRKVKGMDGVLGYGLHFEDGEASKVAGYSSKLEMKTVVQVYIWMDDSADFDAISKAINPRANGFDWFNPSVKGKPLAYDGKVPNNTKTYGVYKLELNVPLR